MTAKELRVGNCLQRSDGSVITVKRLIQNDNDILVNETSGLFTLGYTALPIPLSEEILLKCGFGRDGNTDYYTCRKVGFTINLSGAIGYRTCIWTNEHINHLHQLQNLYFALTGKELEFSLT